MKQAHRKNRPAAIFRTTSVQRSLSNSDIPLADRYQQDPYPLNHVGVKCYKLRWYEELYGWLVSVGLVTLKLMTISTFWTSVAVAIAYWVVYHSPLQPLIATCLTHRYPPTLFPLNLDPAILIFCSAGVGTLWGLTQTSSLELDRRFLVKRLIAGLGYGFAWLSWQWGTPDTLPQAIARLSAVMAVMITVNLGVRSQWVIETAVAMFGTSVMFYTLLTFKLWQPGDFLHLLPSYSPSQDLTFAATVPFFALSSVVLSFWVSINYFVVAPFVIKLGRAVPPRFY
jgi:hypothetical protein